jgi:uncharacterized protein YecT (DUF1311 family)
LQSRSKGSLTEPRQKSSAEPVQRSLPFGAGQAICLLAFVCTLESSGFAQGPDAKAEREPTLAEAKAAFAKADRELNQAWSAAKAAVHSREQARLTASQREWLEFRDERARAESHAAGQKNPKTSVIWHSVAADLTTSRAEWLRGRARSDGAGQALTGVWVDSYGGTMRLVHQPGPPRPDDDEGVGRLLFAIEVVRGPTYHTGGVAGVASWNQRLGWWSDKGVAAEKGDESNLAFADREGCLEVIGANTGYYHGARAYFDGVYCKVETLDEAAQAEVIKAAESGELPEPGENDG